ncbi:hypothetical protein A3752_12585 [Oleiphilus sp. HI0081]|nr:MULTISPECIES: DUF3010 family protein [unclassified Oleiphilus]KZY45611.1 hypothetical protein A3732_09990 [Oleiphilus sp. HI0050]KZY76340.1 hypothetical protein A3740_12990 [Oleiphilus sp. HI0068]KZY84192.1 hypothetical protein A3741_03325 [Oleiphilus sp. HI0069]KZY95457.1 hypothetical protein A3743_00525 [Oleiphilus sp. HI0072]KZZ06489.1 hypothetical protein A3749_02535 [Oleiphilus sp. HI0078]KZZ20144.1 hypothetical protein A3752_12585 [Oleiphilus sp. HI0081]KZZ47691.1 hypothetical prote
MKVCGVELKGSDAIICLLSMDDEIFDIPDCRVRKVTLEKSHSLKYFQATFAKLMTDYQIDTVIIRERPTKGKFAGGAIGFKMEAAIELIDGVDVRLITPVDIKAAVKKNPIPVPFEETGLKVMQEAAFTTAYAYLMRRHYGVDAEQE